MKNKIIMIILGILFVLLGILCIYDYPKNLDLSIYQIIIKYKTPFLTFIFKSISFLFSTPMVIFYCVLSLFIFKNKKYASFFCIMMTLQAVVNNIIKIIFKRVRPNILPLVVEKTYSFPSGHTMTVIFFVMIIGYFFRKKYPNVKIKFLQIIIILLIGISRIYLGVHYFTDIVGAIILSFFLLSFLKNDKIKCRLEKVLAYDK